MSAFFCTRARASPFDCPRSSVRTSACPGSAFPDEIERIDVIAVERDGRGIFAFDSLTGRRAEIRLEIGEEVVFEASRGRLGIVMTNRRALGVAAGSGWKELRFRLQESAPTVALVEDRVAILVTSRRVIGFVSRGDWIVGNLSPRSTRRGLILRWNESRLSASRTKFFVPEFTDDLVATARRGFRVEANSSCIGDPIDGVEARDDRSGLNRGIDPKPWRCIRCARFRVLHRPPKPVHV